MTSQATHRAIVKITVSGKNPSSVNYSRRMYAIIRRYTPDAVEGLPNECFAELTGLRTFFKMTYTEMAECIRKDLSKEIGASFSVRVATVKDFEAALTSAKSAEKKQKHISTYKEMNSLFAGRSFVKVSHRKVIRGTAPTRKIRLTVPFLGKVA